MPKFDEMFVDYVRQQTQALTTIAGNTESVKTAMQGFTDALGENTKVTVEIKEGQIQYQKQTIKILIGIIVVLTLIIGGLLSALNVKGAQVITDTVQDSVR